MAKYLRYLTRRSKANKTLTYQRRYPKDLASSAPSPLFHCPTNCPIDGTPFEQAEAQALGNKQFARECSLLRQGSSGGIIVGSRRGSVVKARVDKLRGNPKISDLLALYLQANPEASDKAVKTRQRHWDSFMYHLPLDPPATAQSLSAIHTALDEWQDDMTQRGLLGASIERCRSSVVRVLRWASLHYRIGWNLELRQVKVDRAKPKKVLSVEEQVRLLDAVDANPCETSSMVALMLAGGVMPSEIGRLDVEEVKRTLGSCPAYVVIGGDGVAVKADARRRIVPVVWRPSTLAVIREWLPLAAERASRAADPAASVNKWLRVRGFDITGHGLRHTLAAVAGTAVANPIVLARVGGWSSAGVALNPIMLGYGAGIEDSELVKGLATEVQRWWDSRLQS